MGGCRGHLDARFGSPGTYLKEGSRKNLDPDLHTPDHRFAGAADRRRPAGEYRRPPLLKKILEEKLEEALKLDTESFQKVFKQMAKMC